MICSEWLRNFCTVLLIYHILNKYKKIPHEVLRPRNYEVNPTRDYPNTILSTGLGNWKDGGGINPFIHYCNHVVTKFNARVIYTYGI